jgi:hypothetical protein
VTGISHWVIIAIVIAIVIIIVVIKAMSSDDPRVAIVEVIGPYDTYCRIVMIAVIIVIVKPDYICSAVGASSDDSEIAARCSEDICK